MTIKILTATLIMTLLFACGGDKKDSGATSGEVIKHTAFLNTFKVQGSEGDSSTGEVTINDGDWSVTWDIIFSRGRSYDSYSIDIFISKDHILSSDDISIYSLYNCLGTNCEHHNKGLLYCTYESEVEANCSDTVSEHGIFDPYSLKDFIGKPPQKAHLIMVVDGSDNLKSTAFVPVLFK